MDDQEDAGRLVFDRARCVVVLTRALQLPAGGELVTSSLGSVPGAVVSRRRPGLFGAPATSVQLGNWRYWPLSAGRIEITHVVDGVLLDEHHASPAEAAAHLTMALSQQLTQFGASLLPDILAVLEGLTVAAD